MQVFKFQNSLIEHTKCNTETEHLQLLLLLASCMVVICICTMNIYSSHVDLLSLFLSISCQCTSCQYLGYPNFLLLGKTDFHWSVGLL